MKYIKYSLFIFIGILFFSCSAKKELTSHKPNWKDGLSVAQWSKNANIYEVNVRQYSPEGTFNAFVKHLPRLKELGVDIIWIMPIHPIGVKKRKGELGSPYSSKNYKAVNPDLGTLQDFKNLVKKAHDLGMFVLLDWVANHSAFDNVWALEHPDWYTHDSLGQITHPQGTDWTDVADLNYENPNMRAAMIDAMKYWVKETNIDGYRCDVAGFVPNDFWKTAIDEIKTIKDVFMLAEWDDPKMHTEAGFDMSYGWGFHHMTNQIAKGEEMPERIDAFMQEEKRYPASAIRMNFTTNHDENSWNGTVKERYGDAADVFAVLAFTLEGMPLLYSGQEANLNKRLSFFGKDTIDWSDLSKQKFFKKLLELKHENPALWNGENGGAYRKIETDDPLVFAYARTKGEKEVVVILNFSDTSKNITLTKPVMQEAVFQYLFTVGGKKMSPIGENKFELPKYGYVVLSK